MAKSYRCTNVKFCMEDENQRRTWEYLHGLTRKDGSYGKVLSDAFVAAMDGREDGQWTERMAEDTEETVEETAGADAGQNPSLGRDLIDTLDVMEQMLEEAFTKGLEWLRGELVEDLRGIPAGTGTYGAQDAPRAADAAETGSLPEMSADMFDFAMSLSGE